MAETIAIIGASTDRAKFGNRAVRAYRTAGFTVYPVNPRGDQIEGLRVYRTAGDVPGPVDRVALYVPPQIGVGLLEQIAALRPRILYVNPGSGSPELLERARELGLAPLEACAIRAIGMDPSRPEDPPGPIPGGAPA